MRADSHESFRQLLIAYHQLGPNEDKRRRESIKSVAYRISPSTLIKSLSTFKVDESARETKRVHESLRPNGGREFNNPHKLSFSHGPDFTKCNGQRRKISHHGLSGTNRTR